MAEEQQTITIDATGAKLGRIASRIASILSGKDRVAFAPNKVPNVIVTVENAAKMAIDEKKRRKVYTRYTGYFGGKKTQTMQELSEKHGYREVLRRAIYGMLPHNRLRAQKMKRVRIQD